MTANQATQREFETHVATHAAYRRGEATWDDVVAASKAYNAAWLAWYATQPAPAPYTEECRLAMGYGRGGGYRGTFNGD